MADKNHYKGKIAEISGWGVQSIYRIQKYSPPYSDDLKRAFVRLIPLEKCQEYYEFAKIQLYENQTCAISIDGFPALVNIFIQFKKYFL